MPADTPTVDLIRGRLRYRLDGTPGARCRAMRPNGHQATATYTARRASVAAVALRWCALGYEDVQIAITARSGARMGSAGAYRPFPATQDEAIQAVRELAALRGPGSGVWRRFLRRLDQSVIVPDVPETPPEGVSMEDNEAFYTHDLTTTNVVDLRGEVEALERGRGRMVGIVSAEAGGIIAYAIGEDNAATIVNGLRTGKDPLVEFCLAYLRVARIEGAVEVDASDAVIARETNRLAQQVYQLASSFVANEFDDREVTNA